MSHKGFAYTMLVVLVVVLAGVLGYVVLVKKPAPTEQPQPSNLPNTQQTPPVTKNNPPAPSPTPSHTSSPTQQPNNNIVSISLGQQFTLKKSQVAKIANTGLEIEITAFFNNPCTGQCVWSGVGIGFEYRFNGEVQRGINLVQAFGYQTTIAQTDHETYANLVVEKMK